MMTYETYLGINESIKNGLRSIIDSQRKELTMGTTNHCDHDKMILESSRWNNTDRILRGMLAHTLKSHDEITSETIEKFIVNTPREDLVAMVNRELESARHGDYHYTYEKEY